MVQSESLIFRHYLLLNHHSSSWKMFGRFRCMRFYPHLFPLGGRHDFVRNISTTKLLNVTTKLSIEEKWKKLENNPYYEKYSEKIKALQKSDPQKFESLLSKLVAESDNIDIKNKVSEKTEVKEKKDSSIFAKKTKTASDGKSGLDAIVKVEKMKTLTPDEIKELWVAYYADKDAICAVIPSEAYLKIKSVYEKNPMFVFPLPRQDGFEMFLGQFLNDKFHFTSVHNYQNLKDFSPDQITISHYTELQEEKSLVLMNGFINDNNLTVNDAQMLAYLIQHYCLNHVDLLQDFNQNPTEFSVQKAIDALDVTEMLQKK